MHEELLKLAQTRMPYGKFKGTLLVDLPERYVVWFCNQVQPGDSEKSEITRLLLALYEIKLNGLEHLFEPLKNPDVSRFE